jgi:5-methyltetrahydropteroyltriglutamate--homocysteine methyltransferase
VAAGVVVSLSRRVVTGKASEESVVAELRTTVAGSWWPLADFEEDLRRFHAGELAAEQADDVLRRAATAAIQQQRELGLTEWTSGEYFTYEFVEHMQRMLTGIRIEVPGKAELFDYDDMAFATIEGEIDAPNGLGYADAYLREKDLAGGVPKATVVGPVEVAINVIGELEGLKGQMPNLVRIVNEELRRLADAGCPHVQLDVPAFTTLITNGAMTVDEATDIVIGCFEGVTGTTRGVHLCSGNLRGRPLAGNLTSQPWADMLQRLDGVVDVAHLALQYFTRWLERDLFRSLPDGMQLAAGIVDEACYWVEPVDKIRDRARDWADVVGEERLWLTLSCGFGRHPARSVPVLREKVANMVEAAGTI